MHHSRQDSIYHGFCYTSCGAQAGTRNRSMGPPEELTHRNMSRHFTMELHLTLDLNTSLNVVTVIIYIFLLIFIVIIIIINIIIIY